MSSLENRNLPQAERAENGPQPEFTSEDFRALDLQSLIKALRGIPELKGVAISDRRTWKLTYLALFALHLRDDLIAWAEGELAKLKEVR
jgi:hypothetical protein